MSTKKKLAHGVEIDLEALATSLHQRWRQARKIIPGRATDGLEKREEHWHFANPLLATGEPFDIANLPFAQLPPAWQSENIMAAKQALAIINNSQIELTLEEAAAAIHEAWLKRHWPVDEKLLAAYPELSEVEKEKDKLVIKESLREFINLGE